MIQKSGHRSLDFFQFQTSTSRKQRLDLFQFQIVRFQRGVARDQLPRVKKSTNDSNRAIRNDGGRRGFWCSVIRIVDAEESGTVSRAT